MPCAWSNSACGRRSKRGRRTTPSRRERPARTPSTGPRSWAMPTSRVPWPSRRRGTSRAWRSRSRPSVRCRGRTPSSRPAASRRRACPSTGTRPTGSPLMRVTCGSSMKHAACISPTGCPRLRRPTVRSRACGSANSLRPIDGCRRTAPTTTTAERSRGISRRIWRKRARASALRTSRTTAPPWRSPWCAATGVQASRPRAT